MGTLLDMEENQGSLFRASRVLEESVPQALSNRPNLVTKAALVEQACALSKYEVNDQKKYDHLLGNYDDNVSFSSVPRQRLQEPISETKKIRILRHHSKIMTAKQ